MDISLGYSIVCLERRDSKLRPKDGWHKIEGAWQHAYKREMHGHHLVIFKPNSGGEWQKYMDGYTRGSVELLKVAKEQLEREAAGEGSAWGIK